MMAANGDEEVMVVAGRVRDGGTAVQLGPASVDLHVDFQPVVELETGATVGFEALARGPVGSDLESPDALFAAAREHGRVTELCWSCRLAALQAARESALSRPAWLFVNVEPAAMGTTMPEEVERACRLGARDFNVAAELTERDVAGRPAETLAAIRQLRAMGWLIALDDVGTDPRSLAMLPVLRPDVVKLDRSVLASAGSEHAAGVMAAVSAYAERTGATVLAEGIEEEAHVPVARALGARLGQGFHFGAPAPRPTGRRAGAPWPIGERQTARPTSGSAWDLVRRRGATSRGTLDVLVAMSHHLEQIASELGSAGLIVTVIERRGVFSAPVRARYVDLSERLPFVAVLGARSGPQEAPGVRGNTLAPEDPLAGDWIVAVLGHHYAGALVGREVDPGVGDVREFDYVLTHDRDLVADVVATAMRRLEPETTERADAARSDSRGC